MDVKEYIESGVVELYAMNALPPEEKKEFERMMILYSEIASELNKVELSIEEFAFANARNPRPQLRAGILEHVQKKTEEKYKIRPPGKVLKDNYSHTITYKYLIAASLAALVVSTFVPGFSIHDGMRRKKDIHFF